MAAYVGCELDLFSNAKNWKAYLASLLRPWISGAVLEVGAGIGANQRYLIGPGVSRWLAVEPDPSLAARITTLDSRVSVRCGTVANISAEERFDAILYIDVLEHIADDHLELRRAATLLAPNGRLVVLSPAHPFLYTAFDAAIGHHRRYTRRSLVALGPEGCRLAGLQLADSVGLLASAGNRLLLRKAMPTPSQIALWDRTMVPLSRWLDPLFGYRLGKTIIAVWRRDSDG